MRENQFQGIVRRALKDRAGAVVLNKIGNHMEGVGWPDLYVAHRAWSGWLELKTGKTDYTGMQRRRIHDFNERYVPSYGLRQHGPLALVERVHRVDRELDEVIGRLPIEAIESSGMVLLAALRDAASG